MKIQWLLTACVAIAPGTIAARGNVTPNPLFGSHGIAAGEMAIPVWGTAEAGEQVTVTLGASKESVVTTGADGKWMVKLPEQKAMGMDAGGGRRGRAGDRWEEYGDDQGCADWGGGGLGRGNRTCSFRCRRRRRVMYGAAE